MEELTERQNKIFQKIVKEYVKEAEPISSQFLDEKYHLGISPATIRSEMKKLDELGLLFQPYHSAGRIPTDKGYRYFVDVLLPKECLQRDKKVLKEIQQIRREIKDFIKFTQHITKFLAFVSSNLAITYLQDKKLLWKEGWEEIFKEPEFREPGFLSEFIRSVNYLEENIDRFCSSIPHRPEIFIGKENPLSNIKNLSFISLQARLNKPVKKEFFIILGPKRMNYSKNINLLNSLLETLEV